MILTLDSRAPESLSNVSILMMKSYLLMHGLHRTQFGFQCLSYPVGLLIAMNVRKIEKVGFRTPFTFLIRILKCKIKDGISICIQQLWIKLKIYFLCKIKQKDYFLCKIKLETYFLYKIKIKMKT